MRYCFCRHDNYQFYMLIYGHEMNKVPENKCLQLYSDVIIVYGMC
jgi:hypothetical protein